MNWQRLTCRAREIKGMTQEDFAEYLNTTQTSVSRWETGATQPLVRAQGVIREIVLGRYTKLLHISEGFLEIVENSLNPLGVVDENGITVEVSFGACEMMGIPRDMAVGRHFNELNRYSVFASNTSMNVLEGLRNGTYERISALVDFSTTETSLGAKAVQWGYTHGFYSAVPVLLTNLEIGIYISVRLMTEKEAQVRGGAKSWDTVKVKSLF